MEKATRLSTIGLGLVFVLTLTLFCTSNSFGKTYREHKLALEFSEQQLKKIYDFANEIGITCFSTPFDVNSVKKIIIVTIRTTIITILTPPGIKLPNHIAKPVLWTALAKLKPPPKRTKRPQGTFS